MLSTVIFYVSCHCKFPAEQAASDRRTIDGLKPLVRMLEWSSTPAVVAAALDALRAICVNNDENKAKVSTSWLVPQLVKLMGSQVSTSQPASLTVARH